MMRRAWTAPPYRVHSDGKIVDPAPPHDWGRWGALDEKGRANLLTPAKVVEAAKLIQTGIAYSLALPIQKGGPVHPGRSDTVHLYVLARISSPDPLLAIVFRDFWGRTPLPCDHGRRA